MHLTSETSKSTGVKTGRIKANDSSEKWKGYLVVGERRINLNSRAKRGKEKNNQKVFEINFYEPSPP